MKENIPLQLGEEIKPIEGYEGLYSITSHGRVWSHIKQQGFRQKEGSFLKLRLDKDKYQIIYLYKNGKVKTVKSHRLTAQHYIPNPLNLPEVNHKDGNKLNNFVGTAKNNYKDGNLEWCDYDHNLKHAMENGLKHPNKKNKFHGVYYYNQGNRERWLSKITVDRKIIYGGYFKNELDAAKSYNNLVIKHNLNRPLNEVG